MKNLKNIFTKLNLKSLISCLGVLNFDLKGCLFPQMENMAKLQCILITKKSNTMRLLLIASLFTVAMTSCKKDFIPTAPKNADITATKDLKVASNFNWATVKSMDIEISPVAKGLLLIQDEQANVIYKALVLSGETHTANITFGTTIEKAFIYFNGAKEEITLGSKKFVSTLK
ncbi:MAG: hypothetical protein H7296_11425 [Bacteroidia bacterium]|nr:hypothetical protein [Bacteroidia bacterium]